MYNAVNVVLFGFQGNFHEKNNLKNRVFFPADLLCFTITFDFAIKK
jgi:hypothetical protein